MRAQCTLKFLQPLIWILLERKWKASVIQRATVAVLRNRRHFQLRRAGVSALSYRCHHDATALTTAVRADAHSVQRAFTDAHVCLTTIVIDADMALHSQSMRLCCRLQKLSDSASATV